jgi:hypothetical protein
MRKVRKLALGNSADYLEPYRAATRAETHDRDIISVIQVFGCLQELLLVQWTNEHVRGWIPLREVSHMRKELELWNLIEVEEVDALMCLFDRESWWRDAITSTGMSCELMRAHKEKTGLCAHSFRDMQLYLEQRLTEEMDSRVSANTDGSITPWNTPRIATEHIMSQQTANWLFRNRLDTLEEIWKLKARLRLGVGLLDADSPSLSASSDYHS